MHGEMSVSIDASFPASELWEVYRSLTLTRIIKGIPNFLVDILVDGDGSVGTVLTLILPSGSPFGPRKEMFTKIDDHTRTKHVDVVEGGYLDIGFKFFRTRFEIIEKGHGSSIIKSSMLFELQDEHANKASLLDVGGLVTITNAVLKYLKDKHKCVPAADTIKKISGVYKRCWKYISDPKKAVEGTPMAAKIEA